MSYTIDDLADELNRKSWAVSKMLKKRDYLKQNGDPRKSTINDGLMDEDGMITDDGWSTFIDELGYRDSGGDDDEEDNDENEEDDDLDFMEDDEGDEEASDAQKEQIRELLSDHTEAFIEKALESPDCGWFVPHPLVGRQTLDSIIGYAYQELDDDESMDDIECVLGLCDAANEYMRQAFSSLFVADDYKFFFDHIRIYDEAYQKGMEHYNDEDKAKKYAESCVNGDEIADFDDSFEECARSNEPWLCLSASGGDLFSEDEKYDADFLISRYYEWGLDGAYGDDEIRLDSKCGSYSFIPAAVAEETD